MIAGNQEPRCQDDKMPRSKEKRQKKTKDQRKNTKNKKSRVPEIQGPFGFFRLEFI